MKLRSIRLENFRGYRSSERIPFEESLTGFIGKNDSGKSSIADALEIFFNSESVKPDADDLNTGAASAEFAIECEFEDLPDTIVLDQSYETNLQAEFLLTEQGHLCIRKEYKVGAKVSPPKVIIVSNHPEVENSAPLHQLKMDALKKLGKDLGIEDNVEDRRVASIWRREIWKLSTKQRNTQIDISKLATDSKPIFDRIQDSLPLFALFKSDRESNDSDPEVKGPFQIAVKRALKEYESEITAIQKKVEDQVTAVALRTLEKLHEMDPRLSEQLTPRLKDQPKWTFNFGIDSDDGIPINKRGSGVRRLILLNFFRAEAERLRAERAGPNMIFAIEEPETSQHPDYQTLLIKTLLALAVQPETQIIITTHVPALAALLPLESIRYVEKGATGPNVSIGTEETLEKVSTALGVLPEPIDRNAEAVVLVEGHGDLVFLRHISEQYKANNAIDRSLEEANIHLIPVGGCGNLKHWVNQKIIDRMDLPWGALFDSDLGDDFQSALNEKQLQKLKAQGRIAFLTRKREPENYIPPELVSQMYSISLSYSETDDAKKMIGKAIRRNPSDVLSHIWPQVSFDQMQVVSRFEENGTSKDEFLEWLTAFSTLVS